MIVSKRDKPTNLSALLIFDDTITQNNDVSAGRVNNERKSIDTNYS